MKNNLNKFCTNLGGLYIIGTFTPRYSVVKAINLASDFMNLFVSEAGKTTNSEELDLLIVGGGPSGLTAGLLAEKQGLKYLILEEESVAANIRKYPKDKVFVVNYMGEQEEIRGPLPFYDAHIDVIISEWEKASHNLQIKTYSSVEDIAKENDLFHVKTAGRASYKAKNVLLAIGQEGSPNRLNAKGEDLGDKVLHRFRDASLHKNENILVVGGGNSAIEAAIALAKENRVSISYRKDIFARLSPDNLEKILDLEKEGIVKIYLSSEVREILSDKVLLQQLDKNIEIPNDKVYILIGFTPKIEFFKKIGCDIQTCIKNQQEK